MLPDAAMHLDLQAFMTFFFSFFKTTLRGAPPVSGPWITVVAAVSQVAFKIITNSENVEVLSRH